MSVARALHYVFKVGNRQKSYDFYTNILKMKVLRHEEFEEGCKATCNGSSYSMVILESHFQKSCRKRTFGRNISCVHIENEVRKRCEDNEVNRLTEQPLILPYNGRWSKTMIGYGAEDDHFVLELTYNYEVGSYRLGNDYFGIYIESNDAYDTVKSAGNYETRHCGKLMLKDPDGHLFMVDKATSNESKVVRVSVNTDCLQRNVDFWTTVLGMKVIREAKGNVSLSYGDDQACWELRSLPEGQKVDRGTAFGRIAFAYPGAKLTELQDKVRASNGKIINKCLTLETPGKPDVQVVIFADPSEHEICFVGDEGFSALSKEDKKSAEIIKDAIANDGSDKWFKNGKTVAI